MLALEGANALGYATIKNAGIHPAFDSGFNLAPHSHKGELLLTLAKVFSNAKGFLAGLAHAIS